MAQQYEVRVVPDDVNTVPSGIVLMLSRGASKTVPFVNVRSLKEGLVALLDGRNLSLHLSEGDAEVELECVDGHLQIRLINGEYSTELSARSLPTSAEPIEIPNAVDANCDKRWASHSEPLIIEIGREWSEEDD